MSAKCCCPSIDSRRCALLRQPTLRDEDLDEDDECECMCHRNDGLGEDDTYNPENRDLPEDHRI